MKNKILIALSLTVLLSCAEKEIKVIDLDTGQSTDMSDTISKIEIVKENVIKEVNGDFYQAKDKKGFMLLCHQAGWSRGEYLETAPKFAEMGYSCLAIDQRSGGSVNETINDVAAEYDQKSTVYADAIPDINAGIEEAFKLNNNEPIILVGSSYSASLVLLLGNKNPKVKAIISFSPGEYLDGYSLADSITGMTKDLYLTSSKSEHEGTVELIKNIGAPRTFTHFFPQNGEGEHGSRALWEEKPDHMEYWYSLEEFLAHLNGENWD